MLPFAIDGVSRVRIATVEVILTKDVETLGAKDEVVRVKDGYARNFLLPHNLAIPATQGNLKIRSKKIDAAQTARSERVSAAQEVAGKLNGRAFVILARSGKEGKLFGSVTAQDVVGCIFAFTGIEVDKRMINLLHPIKSLGVYQINIRLTQGVTASIRIDVRPDEASTEEEVAAQEQATQQFVDDRVPQHEDAAAAEAAPVEAAPEGELGEPAE